MAGVVTGETPGGDRWLAVAQTSLFISCMWKVYTWMMSVKQVNECAELQINWWRNQKRTGSKEEKHRNADVSADDTSVQHQEIGSREKKRNVQVRPTEATGRGTQRLENVALWFTDSENVLSVRREVLGQIHHETLWRLFSVHFFFFSTRVTSGETLPNAAPEQDNTSTTQGKTKQSSRHYTHTRRTIIISDTIFTL